MISRYENQKISEIFSDIVKLNLWQKTELAVIEAMVNFNKIDRVFYDQIKELWSENLIDIEWWKKRDKEIHHDLNAFLDERYRFLPTELHGYVHKNITSYDTEEAPFVLKLQLASLIISDYCASLTETLKGLALKYRYTIMHGRTHGQEAELQSFGARVLTWLKDLQTAVCALSEAEKNLKYSKLSGAIGKYGSIDPAIEKEALNILGLEPYYGATQIMPRILYAPLAQALSNLVLIVDKIATDIRLSARSGRVLMQEPFKKKQKGSSAMPHKKNPIVLEQIEGLAKMAVGYAGMITGTIKTWEERTIEQSSVERVAWPDLFHVTCRALSILNKTLVGLKVYPDNMLKEIYESRGVYASSEIKEFFKENLAGSGLSDEDILSNEDIYRMVQLAAFNVFRPSRERLVLRETIPNSFEESKKLLFKIASLKPEKFPSLKDIFPAAGLEFTDELDISQEQINQYNHQLKKIFWDETSPGLIKKWEKIFTPEFLLKNEAVLYKEILGLE